MGASGEERHIMGAQDSSGDTEEECERLGGSLELYRESPWDGSWREGCRKICEHRIGGSQEGRLPKTFVLQWAGAGGVF